MFRDAAALDRQRTAASFDKALARYAETAEKWYDGTVGSVDRRLAACDRLLQSARATVARLPSINDSRRYLHAAGDLETDRRALTALRDDLLTGASSREDVVGPPGWRHASDLADADDEQEGVGAMNWSGWQKRNKGHMPEDDRRRQRDEGFEDWKQQGYPHHGAAEKPPGTVAGSNEFEHPAPRTKAPPLAKEFSVTKLKVSPLTAALHRDGIHEPKWDPEVGDWAVPTLEEDMVGKTGEGFEPLPTMGRVGGLGPGTLPEAGTPGRMPYPPPNMNDALKPIYQTAIDTEQDPFEALKPHIGSADLRWVELESARFVAANSDTLDDNHELATRAHDYAAMKTSTFTPARSAAICERFVERVANLGRRAHRPAVVRTAAYQDFDDQALYLC